MTPFMNLKILLSIYLKAAISGLNEPHGSSPSAIDNPPISQIAAFVATDKSSDIATQSNQSTTCQNRTSLPSSTFSSLKYPAEPVLANKSRPIRSTTYYILYISRSLKKNNKIIKKNSKQRLQALAAPKSL
jgi:hypothetical protein